MGVRGPYDSGYSATVPQTLGERLKWLRIRKGMTQAEAAAALQTDAPTISSWERDRARPSGTALVGLASFYGVPPRALENGDGLPVGPCTEPAEVTPDAQDGNLTVMLDRIGNTGLVMVDGRTQKHRVVQHMDGMGHLMQALNKGKRVWLVIE